MSIRFLLGVGAGFAAGYAVSRVMDGMAMGLPLSTCLRLDQILQPVPTLAMIQGDRTIIDNWLKQFTPEGWKIPSKLIRPSYTPPSS